MQPVVAARVVLTAHTHEASAAPGEALPGLLAGSVLTFARALGEFGATIILAGNIEGETRQIPLAVYTLLNIPGAEPGVLRLTAVSIGLSLLALLAAAQLSGLRRRRSGAR